MLLALACGSPTAPTPPPPSAPAYVLATAFASPDAAARPAEVWGGTLDMGGAPIAGNIALRSSPMLVGQVRGVTVTNCWGGWTGNLSVSAGVSSYFGKLSECLVLGSVDASRMFNSTVENVWLFGGGITLTGPSYYNVLRDIYVAGACVTFTAAAGPSLGANHNRIEGGRCQGTVTIGTGVQDIDVSGMAFEGCDGACLRISGTRIHIGFNRIECNSPIGIEILPGSDGWIDEQYWSSCGTRIVFAPGADPLAWRIAPQPQQQ